jgi:hypothetical protein
MRVAASTRNLILFATLSASTSAVARGQAPGLPAQVVRINPAVSTATYPTLEYSGGATSNDFSAKPGGR